METIYTIGHSTHPIDDFITILKSYDIQQLVDIRTIHARVIIRSSNRPRSRSHSKMLE